MQIQVPVDDGILILQGFALFNFPRTTSALIIKGLSTINGEEIDKSRYSLRCHFLLNLPRPNPQQHPLHKVPVVLVDVR